jgi:hypothetical protein
MLTLLRAVNCLLRIKLKHLSHVVDSEPPIAVSAKSRKIVVRRLGVRFCRPPRRSPGCEPRGKAKHSLAVRVKNLVALHSRACKLSLAPQGFPSVTAKRDLVKIHSLPQRSSNTESEKRWLKIFSDPAAIRLQIWPS